MEQTKLLAKQFVVSVVVLSAVLVFASFTSAASTWTPPSAAAPSGNTDTPLNTGAVGQIKAGGLVLNTGGAANGLIVQSGKVGIGTQTPVGTLDVQGSICLSGSCITAWGETPTSAPAATPNLEFKWIPLASCTGSWKNTNLSDCDSGTGNDHSVEEDSCTDGGGETYLCYRFVP